MNDDNQQLNNIARRSIDFVARDAGVDSAAIMAAAGRAVEKAEPFGRCSALSPNLALKKVSDAIEANICASLPLPPPFTPRLNDEVEPSIEAYIPKLYREDAARPAAAMMAALSTPALRATKSMLRRAMLFSC